MSPIAAPQIAPPAVLVPYGSVDPVTTLPGPGLGLGHLKAVVVGWVGPEAGLFSVGASG